MKHLRARMADLKERNTQLSAVIDFLVGIMDWSLSKTMVLEGKVN